jgi:glycosyltransferase involved in cell wall biosynthesis
MILLPDDLPNDTPHAAPVVRLKPVLAPAFISLPQNSNRVLSGEQRISRLAESSLPLELPGTYVLYHGPRTAPDLQRLLEAWNWATKALGDDTLLVLAGLRSSEISLVNNMLGSAAFQHTVQALPELEIKHLAAVYQGCRAVIHPAPVSPWEVPARLALANGKPLVGVETPWTDAICGPAAYLVPSGGKAEDIPRALGAALISVMVEESLAEGLSQAARQRSAAWLESSSRELFQQQLLEAYRLLTFQNAGGE